MATVIHAINNSQRVEYVLAAAAATTSSTAATSHRQRVIEC